MVNMTKTKAKNGNPQTEVELTPDILALLSEFTPEEIETGVVTTGRPAIAGSHTSQDLKDAYQAAVIEQTIGDMLRAVREQHDHSLKDAAKTVGISRGRAHQLEQPEVNLRFDTLQRFAGAYGYTVRVELVPKAPNQKTIIAELPENTAG